jgi:hypothetical protein
MGCCNIFSAPPSENILQRSQLLQDFPKSEGQQQILQQILQHEVAAKERGTNERGHGAVQATQVSG